MIELKNVTLQTKNGETLLENSQHLFSDQEPNYVIGKSGVGKSTLLKAIYGQSPIVSGEILLNGQRLEYKECREIVQNRRKMGFIFQDFRLIDSWTVFQAIAYVLYSNRLSEKIIQRKVKEIVERLGLENKLYQYCHELSEGEQQRVAIARALVKDPQILLADEPTENLDLETRQEINQVMMELSRAKKMTTIIVTHDYTNVQQGAIHRMENNRLITIEKEALL